MGSLKKQQKWIALFVIFTFSFMLQISVLPLRSETNAASNTKEVSKSTETTGSLEMPGKVSPVAKKKHFPWLWVVLGAVLIAGGVYLYLNYVQKCTLTVNKGLGVAGIPDSSSTKYKSSQTVAYSYTLQPGYYDLQVILDGTPVAAAGSIAMKKSHTLTASAASNLELEWLFNGNAQDTSGKNRHGTAFNATLTADRHGAASGAYYFNGTNAYIQGPFFQAHKNNNITVSFWVKLISLSDTRYFIKAPDFSLIQASGNGINFNIVTTLNNTAFGMALLGTWTHIAGTFDGTVMRTYSNGILYHTRNALPGPIASNNLPIELGRLDYNSTYWQGSLDDLRIYSVCMSQSEIAQLAAE